MTDRKAASLLLLLALAACDGYTGIYPEPAISVPPSSAAPVEAGQTYKVVSGDTVDSVAQQLNVPVEALIRANHLAYPYVLQRGQVLAVPGRGAAVAARVDYTVVPGDSLSRIARRHGTTVAALAQLNNLAPPYAIKVGQHLSLPGRVSTEVAATGTGELTQMPPSIPAPSVPAAGTSKLTTEALLPLPGASAATAPSLPPPGSPPDSAAPATSGDDRLAALPPPNLQPVTPAAPPPNPATGSTVSTGAAAAPSPASPTAPEPPAKTTASNAGSASASGSSSGVLESPSQAPTEGPAPAPRGSGKFLWPVNGKVISPFGTKEGGLHNDGINIAAPLGTPVRAAENGVVVYAGNELRGFGNLLLIRHADGWVSAYAHCDAFLVKRGDQVKRGQVVARVGQTGAVSAPQLHFELRKGAQAVDPMGELGPQGA